MGQDFPEFPHSDEIRSTMLGLYMDLNDSEEAVLLALAEAEEPLTGAGLAEGMEYTDSTVYRCLNSLGEDLGSVLEEEDDGYWLDSNISIAVRDFVQYREGLEEYEKSSS